MPKQHKRLYTVGAFWLVPPCKKYPHDYGISWYDGATRQTPRVGTKCADLEDAKTAINKHALEHGDGAHKDELLLQTLQRYYLSYAVNLPSAKQVTVTIKFVTEHSADTMVSAFQADKQKDLVGKLRVHGLADDTIARHFTDIFAALSHAEQFNHLPKKVIPARLAKRFWGERTQPRKRKSVLATKRALTMQEWGRIFDAAARNDEDSVRLRYLITQIGTIGRPSAVIELTGQQVDLVNGIVDLNPPGREQNKKRRPKVPVCETFRKWLVHWHVSGEGHLLMYRGRPVATRNFIRRVIREAKVPNCNPYTFRHSISSWLAWRGVSKWERKKAMGHAKIDGGSTDTYTHYDAIELRSVAVALEELFQAIAPYTRFNLLRNVIEDQGDREALWHGVPQAFTGRAVQTHLISAETFNEVQEARPETRPGGALSISKEIAIRGLREAVESADALDQHRIGNQLHPLSTGDGSRTSRTGQTVAASRPSDPPLVGSYSMELPSATLNFHSVAWRLRGIDSDNLFPLNHLHDRATRF